MKLKNDTLSLLKLFLLDFQYIKDQSVVSVSHSNKRIGMQCLHWSPKCLSSACLPLQIS